MNKCYVLWTDVEFMHPDRPDEWELTPQTRKLFMPTHYGREETEEYAEMLISHGFISSYSIAQSP